MNVDGWNVRALSTGRFRLDGGAMFGNVPKVLWSRKHAADDKNRIELDLRVLLVEGYGRRLLVDTGTGNQWDPKEQAIFDVAVADEPGVCTALRAAGVDPATVTDVVITHLHFDHAGGVTRRGPDGPVLTFPKARHHVQRANLETASAPNEREKASYLARTVGPLAGADLNLVDGAAELFPGIFVEPSDGHTTGLQTVRVGAGDGAVIFGADMFPTAAHVPTAWTMGYDLCPRTLMKEKRAVLERAVRHGWALVLEHDPFRDAVRVTEKDGRFESAEDVAIQ